MILVFVIIKSGKKNNLELIFVFVIGTQNYLGTVSLLIAESITLLLIWKSKSTGIVSYFKLILFTLILVSLSDFTFQSDFSFYICMFWKITTLPLILLAPQIS